MLTKNSKLDIPADDPFDNDKLERKVIAENLTYLVQSTNQPFVISIEAPWGWGKTTFIEMWKAYLEQQGHTCLYFNAWENDFVEDPLIAFIGEIEKAIGEKNAKGNLEKRLNTLQDIGGKILRKTLPFAVQLATQGILSQENVKQASEFLSSSSDEIAKFSSEIATERIRQYEKDKQGIKDFKKELGEFAKEISEVEGNKAPLVFFVDELDRCRPDFGIALLERIKHIFNAEGIIFVLGIDREQIEQSVKSIYGQEMKPDGYLRRFIDYGVRLPEPKINSYCDYLFRRFRFDEVFSAKQINNEKNTFLKILILLIESYSMSLRAVEQIFTELNVILRTMQNSSIHLSLLAFLVVTKNYKKQDYLRIKDGLSYDEIKSLIVDLGEKFTEDDDYLTEWFLAYLETYFVMYLPEKERMIAKESLLAKSNSEDDNSRHAKKVLENFSTVRHVRGSYVVRNLIQKMDLVDILSL